MANKNAYKDEDLKKVANLVTCGLPIDVVAQFNIVYDQNQFKNTYQIQFYHHLILKRRKILKGNDISYILSSKRLKQYICQILIEKDIKSGKDTHQIRSTYHVSQPLVSAVKRNMSRYPNHILQALPKKVETTIRRNINWVETQNYQPINEEVLMDELENNQSSQPEMKQLIINTYLQLIEESKKDV